jgi:hypothetical protein
METPMMESGLMVFLKMDMELKAVAMMINLKVNIIMVSEMEKENMFGKLDIFLMVNMLIIYEMDMEFSH